MAKFLITGGAGFIGSALARTLVTRGDSVRIFDNLSSGKLQNLASVERHVELVRADIRDAAALKAAAQGVDYVLHQAAIASVPRSIDDPVETHEVNITGTLNVFTAARDAGVRRVVFASSSAVYGDSPELPKREAMPTKCLSPY